MPTPRPISTIHDDLPELRQAFGRQLRLYRTAQRRSHLDLAEALGLTPRTLIRLEQGRCWPRLNTFLALCAALGVPPAALLHPLAYRFKPVKRLPPAPGGWLNRLFALLAEPPAKTPSPLQAQRTRRA